MADRPRPFSSTARLLHWINSVAILGLMSSGWAIYNAAPFYAIRFPESITLGGYLTPALRWHFAFMWTLIFCASAQIGLRLLARRGGPTLTPVTPRAVLSEVRDALHLRLSHVPGIYIHTQRLLYLGVLALLILAILSGLALWKPVQLQGVTGMFGGYEAARRWHFWAMAGLAAFTIIHLAMLVLVPSSLLAMMFGGNRPG